MWHSKACAYPTIVRRVALFSILQPSPISYMYLFLPLPEAQPFSELPRRQRVIIPPEAKPLLPCSLLCSQISRRVRPAQILHVGPGITTPDHFLIYIHPLFFQHAYFP